MDDADFEKIVPGKDYTAAYMLDGLIQHNVYHAADRTVEETGIPAVRSSGLVRSIQIGATRELPAA